MGIGERAVEGDRPRERCGRFFQPALARPGVADDVVGAACDRNRRRGGDRPAGLAHRLLLLSLVQQQPARPGQRLHLTGLPLKQGVEGVESFVDFPGLGERSRQLEVDLGICVSP